MIPLAYSRIIEYEHLSHDTLYNTVLFIFFILDLLDLDSFSYSNSICQHVSLQYKFIFNNIVGKTNIGVTI